MIPLGTGKSSLVEFGFHSFLDRAGFSRNIQYLKQDRYFFSRITSKLLRHAGLELIGKSFTKQFSAQKYWSIKTEIPPQNWQDVCMCINIWVTEKVNELPMLKHTNPKMSSGYWKLTTWYFKNINFLECV